MIEIKGSVVGDTIKVIKSKYGEQAFNTVLSLLKPETRAMFEKGHVMPINWYPLDDFIQFLEADLKVTANGNEQDLIKRSEALIERQLSGIYRIFVKLGSPGFVLNRMSAVHETYFRGVAIEVNLLDHDKATLRYTGFEKRHQLIGKSIIGFYRKAMEISGAKDVKAEFTTSIEEGKGYCELALSWRDK